MNAGKKAWDVEDPTSPNVKHVIAMAKRAVCAAASAPPSAAAEAM